jgi:hypothetical protein
VADVFDEVEESLRQETASKVWKRAAPFVIGGVVLIVAGVGVFEYMRYARNSAINGAATEFSAGADALESGDLAAARAGLAPVAQGKGGFADVASHLLSEVAKREGGDAAAMAAPLEQAANRGDGLLSDMAVLKLAYLKADTVSLTDLEALVAPLLEEGGNLGALARELVAAKAAATGDVERARRDYQALTLEIDAPQDMQRRVQQALLVLPKAVPATTPAATATPAPAAAPAAAPETTGQPTQ